MKKNLNVDHYQNGDPIPQAINPKVWENLKTGAWCFYNNDPANGTIYGKLYNWYAVNDTRGLAPSGYHVPSDAEWTRLESYLKNNSQYWCNNNSYYIAKSLAFKELWYTNDWECAIGNNLDANNTSGFSGLPGGYRHIDGSYYTIRYYGMWWSSTDYGFVQIGYSSDFLSRGSINEVLGFSVRCVKD